MAYVYSTHKTRDLAEMALESYFAEGVVCEAERVERWYLVAPSDGEV